jgi:IstB-like ATP binding protein
MISRAVEAEILRLYHAEGWPIGTIARQFEVITRRYQQRATVLTTNKSFGEWNQVFPNAACVVTLVDRLVHRSEILAIDGDSYRFKEAQEAAAAKAALRAARKQKRSR